jgi:hypothetical protein
MTKTGTADRIRPLALLHLLAMCVLAVGWAVYCWQASRPALVAAGAPGGLEASLDRVLAVVDRATSDLFVGLCTLSLFAVGTGIYVRRFQVWMDARTAGEAVAYGGADLKDRAMAANARPGTMK